MPKRLFELALLAALLHDSGYLKKHGDTDGTGAKYTIIHVHRSAVFAAEFIANKGLPPVEIKAVQNMILCTGVNARLEDAIPFQNESERITGFALGSADLMGQMAAADYVDKLPCFMPNSRKPRAITRDQEKPSFVSGFAARPTCDGRRRDSGRITPDRSSNANSAACMPSLTSHILAAKQLPRANRGQHGPTARRTRQPAGNMNLDRGALVPSIFSKPGQFGSLSAQFESDFALQ